MKISQLLVSTLIMASTLNAYSLTKGVEKLIEFETKANAVTQRSNELIKMPHVEIPLNMVGTDFADRLEGRIKKSLVFEKNGIEYVRWILNPEDTKWGLELMSHFKTKGLNLEIQYYFNGYQTASRSYIAEDPVSGAQFSVKSSTNTTGGHWRDKKQPVGEAVDGRLLSDFLFEQNLKKPFQHFVVMDEPAVLTVNAIDQAVVIRDLGSIKRPQYTKYLLPGFSALHEIAGREIALKNGATNIEAFWREHYIQVAGRALGELAARTGIQFDSPHSQNFLIELDADFKPTGKLVLRDMSDLYIDKNFVNALLGNDNKIMTKFSQTDNIHDYIAAGFGPLHGNKSPKWLTQEQYNSWNKVFFQEFEKTFSEISGYNIASMQQPKITNGLYFQANYRLDNKPKFASIFQMMSSEGVVSNYNGQLLCRFLF